jgi:hypothetical protein
LKNVDFAIAVINSEYFKNDDEETVYLLNQNDGLLAVAFNNILTIMDVEVVTVNSPICAQIPEFVELIKNQLSPRWLEGVKVRNSKLMQKATLLGGLANTMIQVFNLKELKFPESGA